jgi:hypothetical protein
MSMAAATVASFPTALGFPGSVCTFESRSSPDHPIRSFSAGLGAVPLKFARSSNKSETSDSLFKHLSFAPRQRDALFASKSFEQSTSGVRQGIAIRARMAVTEKTTEAVSKTGKAKLYDAPISNNGTEFCQTKNVLHP